MEPVNLRIPSCSVEVVNRGHEIQIFFQHVGSHDFTHMLVYRSHDLEVMGLNPSAARSILDFIHKGFVRAEKSYEQGTRVRSIREIQDGS